MLWNPAVLGMLAPRLPPLATQTPITYLTAVNADGDIVGTAGSDWIKGGPNFQGMYTGGGGPTYFVFSLGDGPDWIVDFRAGTDKLVLVNPGPVATAPHTDPGSGVTGTMVFYNSGIQNNDRVFLENVGSFDIAANTVTVSRVPVYMEEVTAPGTVVTPPPPASIALDPPNPGNLGTAPQTWSTSAVVTALDKVKWAVFHKDTAGNYTSEDTWHEVAVSGGRAAISAPFARAGQLLVVKSLDEKATAESGQVSFSTAATVPAAPTTDAAFAAAWKDGLTMGLNVERNELLSRGLITDAYLDSLKGVGLTHVRYAAASGGNIPYLLGLDDYRRLHFDAVSRTLGRGMKAHLDLFDIVYEDQFNDALFSRLTECAEAIAGLNWDPSKVIIGGPQEYGGGSNLGFEANRERVLAILRSKLPNHILVSAGADWNDPWTLLNGTMKVSADKRVIYQWHKYEYDAGSVTQCEILQRELSAWEARNGVSTYCGEWSYGPPSGRDYEGGPVLVDEDDYWKWPYAIDASAKGMGQQRPCAWVVTDGDWWRVNKSRTDPYLRDEIVTAYRTATAHIRSQAYFTATASSATTPAAPAAEPTIALSPQDPGTLTEASAGAGAKVRTTVTTTGMTSITWVVVRADYSWRTPVTVQTTGSAVIEPLYMATGDFLKVLKGDNSSVYKDGGAVTLRTATATGTTATTAPATGGAATRIDVLLRGQSNAQLAAQHGSDGRFRDTLAALTGVPVNLISRHSGGDGDNTIHSSTSTAWVDPYDTSFGWWLSPPGANYDGDVNRSAIDYSQPPAGWHANGPLTETLQAVRRFRSTEAGSVFIDARMPHHEYDLVMYGHVQPHYRAFAWEVTKRIQAEAGKAAGRHFVLYGHCPYVGKELRAVDAIGEAWAADAADHGVIVAGNMMDADPYGGTDYSHWGPDGPNRSFPRVAFDVAVALWNKGLLPSAAIDLSDAPSKGPRIGAVSKTSASALSVQVVHDRGTALAQQGGTIDWGAFWCSWDGGGADATAGSISGSTINLSFPQSIGANPKLTYCRWPHFRANSLIIDNWHAIRPAKFAGVPNIGAVVFPLQRTLRPVAF